MNLLIPVVLVAILVGFLFMSSKSQPEQTEKKILEALQDTADDIKAQKALKESNEPNVRKMYELVEQFIRNKNLIVYGGLALNEILPAEHQFYGPSDIPDYDVFSPNARSDAVEFAQILHNAGLPNAQVSEAAHPGTYKVFADAVPILDVTQMEASLFDMAFKDSYVGSKDIRYSGNKWLRIDLYGELADVRGNVDRWPKVYKRLMLLNKYAPIDFSQGIRDRTCSTGETQEALTPVYKQVIDFLAKNKLPVYGTSTVALYQLLTDDDDEDQVLPFVVDSYDSVPDVYALSQNPEADASKLVNALNQTYVSDKVKFTWAYSSPETGTYLSDRPQTTVFMRTPDLQVALVEFSQAPACVSVETYDDSDAPLLVTTPQASLNMLLNGFFNPHVTPEKQFAIMCLAEFLFNQMNALGVDGLPSPDDISPENCFGRSVSLTEMRREQAESGRRPFRWYANRM